MLATHEKCNRCDAVYDRRQIEDMTECVDAGDRFQPPEYEVRCDCGSTDLREFYPCTECNEAEPLDGTDICADCLNDVDPEAYQEYLAETAA